MTTFLQDIRYGARLFTKNPLITVLAILALAISIGANSAVFSVINSVLLRPLPYPEVNRLMMVWGSNRKVQLGSDQLPISAGDFRDIRRESRAFDQVAAMRTWPFTVAGPGFTPELVWGVRVSQNLFSTMGINPTLGRVFTPEEDQPASAGRVAVISHSFWKGRFGSNPKIIGQTLLVDSKPTQIVGVLPEGFSFPQERGMPDFLRFPDHTEMWLPLNIPATDLSDRDTRNLALVARLKPGFTAEQGQSDLSSLSASLQKYEADKDWGLFAVPLQQQVVQNSRPALLILSAAVAFVLLIACANVANLLLVRAANRRREIAIRVSFGAARSRIVRQLLTESILMALCGGAIGLFLGYLGLEAFARTMPGSLAGGQALNMDVRVLLFTFVISVSTGVLFGLAPALQMTKRDMNDVLKESGRSSISAASGNRIRAILVVCEIGIAFVLLAGTGLLLKSLIRLQQVDPGFKTENVVKADIMLPFIPPSPYADNPERMASFTDQVVQRISSLPGVKAAAITTALPLSGTVDSTTFNVDGMQTTPGQELSAQYSSITPGIFTTLSIPLIQGRTFTAQDTRSSMPVVIINARLAKLVFPNQDPIGRQMEVGFAGPGKRQIVGIVGDVRQSALGSDPSPAIYLPFAQSPSPFMSLIVRSSQAHSSMTNALESATASVDPSIPVSKVAEMDKLVSQSLAQRRFTIMLMGAFAAVALLLVLVGIYGVLSYSVAQRTQEFGIRMALGAQKNDVLWHVVRYGMKLAGTGMAAGLICSIVATRLMASLLYGVNSWDPITLVSLILTLSVFALAACLVPALRAVKVDPLVCLRYE
jgi:putative ABC transport system permease protein